MRAVITVVGKDMVGIVATVATECAATNANILDVTQSVFENDIFAMVMLGLYRMFMTDSPVGDALVKLGILLILFSRYLPEVEGRGKHLLVIAVNLAAVILVLTGTLLPGGGPLSLGSVLKTGGLILGVACWVGIRHSQPVS